MGDITELLRIGVIVIGGFRAFITFIRARRVALSTYSGGLMSIRDIFGVIHYTWRLFVGKSTLGAERLWL